MFAGGRRAKSAWFAVKSTLMKPFQAVGTGVAITAVMALCAASEAQEHGRKYKPPPPTAHIVITVEKGFNSKPLPNAAVVFHATREGKDDGNLEVKTDPEGKATIDLIEVGSHLTVQVIANGFATYATDFDVDTDKKEMTIKLLRPRAQVSAYKDNEDKASDLKPGVQEHVVQKPGAPNASTSAPQSH